MTEASLTPSSDWNSGTAIDSSLLVSWFWSRSLVTASWMTGKSSKEKVATVGVTLSGSWLAIRLRASCTFCSAVVRSVP